MMEEASNEVQDGVKKSIKHNITAEGNTNEQVMGVTSPLDMGYVQGMNFIVGSLLMHCSEEVTFWLFVALIEDYEMRDIYMPGLPGLYKHIAIMEYLMERHLPTLYEHF